MTDTTDTRIAVSVRELVNTAQSVAGIKGTPQQPPEKITEFPTVTAFPIDFDESWNTAEDSIYLYRIAILIIESRRDVIEGYKRSVGLAELVINELRQRIREKGKPIGYTYIDTFGEITADYRALRYAGVGDYMGWRLVLNDVKIRKDVT